jgi:serine/threonine-protein kinase HipA
MAGVDTGEHRVEKVAEKRVFLSRRFDRAAGGVRIPFLSAMSMMNRVDGDRGSYPEIVEALRASGASAKEDAKNLFRRMIVNILVSNVDDHLRNHGFLRKGNGWILSPAYDINPVPHDVRPHYLSTNVDLTDGTGSIELARSAAAYFDLELSEADEIIRDVATATEKWRSVAETVGVRNREIDRMSSAFEHDQLRAALVAGRGHSASRRL